MSETEDESEADEFVNYLPAMPKLSEDSLFIWAVRKVTRRRGKLRRPVR